MNFQEKFEYARQKLLSFKNKFEVKNFRNFLLLVLNLYTNGPDALLGKLGLGSKNRILMPYDPTRKHYFFKFMTGFTSPQPLLFFHHIEKISSTFINGLDSIIFTDYLTDFEKNNLIHPKIKLLTPEVIDFMEEADNQKKEIKVGIESLFVDLYEFLISQSLEYVFLLEGDGDEPDLLFSINLMLDTGGKDSLYLFYDVYVDEDHRARNTTFIKTEKEDHDNKLEFLKEIKEASHAEIFNSNYIIVVPISPSS